MAGINVNQITSTLAKLPDQALQQYAQLHKNDPYVMSLAVSESNRRKELRAAGQGAQGMQPQPKVADAAIAQMGAQPMPEEMGIGALPAQNMQQMADGGIAGYDGYDEGGMTYGQEPVMMMAEGGVARYNGSQSQFVQDLAGIPRAYEKWWQRNREEDATKAAKEQDMAQRRQEMLDARQKTSFTNYLFGSPEREAEGRAELAQLTKPTGSMPEPGYTRAGMKGDPRLNVPLTQPLPAEQAPPAAPKADTGRKVSGIGAPATRPAALAQSDAARYAALQKEMGVGPEAAADLAWQRSQLAERMRAQAKGELEDFDKEAAARGEAFKGREERLAKREAGLGKQKDETAGLALLEAGLAIMSTPGKLAEAVGKGAQAGLKTYGAGLEKLRAAQEKLDDARDQIEEYRRNEANMTAKERRQFKSQINRTETDIEKMAVDAAKDMYGFKREDTKAVFNASEQSRNLDKEIAGRESAARIAAGPAYERNKLLKESQGNEAKVRAEYGKLQAKVMGELSKDQDYLMAPEAKKQLMQTAALRQALMNNPFLAPYASGIGFSSAPTGKVYDLTED